MHKTLVALALILSTGFATLADINLANNLPVASGIAVTGDTGLKVGNHVTNIGDVNGDTFPDYAVTGTDTNVIYVVLGQSAARAAAFALTGTAATSFTKITVTKSSTAAGANVGLTVGYAGDVNGDSVADIVIGNPKATSNAGEAYIVYGKQTGWADVTINAAWTTAPGVGVYINAGTSTAKLGSAVSTAGDLNNDGKDDVLIGAPDWSAATNTEGAVCVVFGAQDSATVTGARNTDTIDCTTHASVTATRSGADGRIIKGDPAVTTAGFGSSVALAGDLNRDGKKDVIIGAPGAGKAYIIYGQTTAAWTAVAAAYAVATETLVTEIIGTAADKFGQNVGTAGDLNGDTYTDVFVGAPEFDGTNTRTNCGQVVVIWSAAPASSGAALADITVASLGTSGVTITGAAAGDYLGWESDGGADFNKDTVNDIIIAAPLSAAARTGATAVGKVYIIYGKTGFTNVDLATALTSTTGITITGAAGSSFGESVSVVGDVTRDTVDDWIVGAPTANSNTGRVYEFRGQKIDTPAGSGSGAALSASLLVLASFFVALMF